MNESFKKSTLREYFESIVIAVILALFIRTFVVQAFKIPTGSMENNLLIGDHLLVNKFIFGPAPSSVERLLLPVAPVKRGDIVVFKYPEEPERDFIKRVIGLPGETLEVRSRNVFINGQKLDEPYAVHLDLQEIDRRDNFGPVSIPPDDFFMMGDNRDNSNDSRFWGFAPRANLIGTPLFVYWSYEDQPYSQELSLTQWVEHSASVAAHFFTKTRWLRTGTVLR